MKTIYSLVLKFGDKTVELGDMCEGHIEDDDPVIKDLENRDGLIVAPSMDDSIRFMSDSLRRISDMRIACDVILGVMSSGYDNFVANVTKIVNKKKEDDSLLL